MNLDMESTQLVAKTSIYAVMGGQKATVFLKGRNIRRNESEEIGIYGQPHTERRREDLNLRGAFKTPTSLAVRRTRPGYATSPRTLEV